MEIRYLGWSGITLRHSGTLIGFDLFGDGVSWDVVAQEPIIVLCLTHGHPEHAGSLRDFLETAEVRPYLPNIHLVSSAQVIRHINRHHILAEENLHPIEHGGSLSIAGITVTAFTWVHMPLLPPGLLPKAEYIAQLVLHPVDLVRIGTMGLSLPANAPQLGFHITYPDGKTVLNYSEGVHRLTDAAEVRQIAKTLPADMLLFAVEPDDAETIPHWVKILDPRQVYIYEAHRPWRNLFHLPFIDVNAYAGELSERFPQMTFHALTTVGQTLLEGAPSA